MPSWNIHLEIGERLNKKLKFSGKQKEDFLFGCILPDINNGYINKRVKVVREHEDTHWAFNKKSSLNFYAKYKRQIDNLEPIYLGYLVHLYTDGYFNYDFYRKINKVKLGQGLNHIQKREIKHNDFWKYNIKFRRVKLELKDAGRVAEVANEIRGIELDAEAIEEVEEILHNEDFNEAMKDKPYLFYSEEKLDKVMDEMIEHFSKDYLRKLDA